MNRTDLQQLADVRIAEAAALLQVQLPDGAYYLAGYAVECALKACIAKTVNQHDFPDKQLANDCYTHNLEALVRLAELEAVRKADVATNPALGLNWRVVNEWNEASRYGRRTLPDAQRMLDAVNNQTSGVLPWIKGLW